MPSKSGGGRDSYPTPQIYADFAIKQALEKHPNARSMLEPGCGAEAPFLKAFQEQAVGTWTVSRGIELTNLFDDSHTCRYGVDFLDAAQDHVWFSPEVEKHGGWDLIVTNPPYSIAEEVIRKSLRILHPMGLAVFLLRIGFAGSIKRAPFFRERPPVEIGEFVRRFSFDGKGTDYTDYCLFFWLGDTLDKFQVQSNGGRHLTKFYWIDNSKKDTITTFGE
jgi:hypothetical protein